MDDLGGLFSLITAIMFFILLSKFNTRFGRMESEFEEMKERMDELLKKQNRNVTSDEAEKEREVLVSTAQEAESLAEQPAVESMLLYEEPLQEEVFEEPIVEIPCEKKKINYEKFIGENLFGKIGILIFVIGIGFFVKYAIDQEWINETMRTILGFLTGFALLAVAERLQKKYRTFSSLLAGGAFAVFYLTIAIAFHYYQLFSQSVAFVLLIVVTVLMSFLSVLYNRRELAVISLVGGFFAPFIVSSGEGNYIVLFTYLSILNIGMFGLSIYKKWSELLVVSFVFTYLIMGLYVFDSYSLSMNMRDTSGPLFLFATLFYFIFLFPVVSILRTDDKKISRILLSIIITNNFLYLLLGALFLQGMLLSFDAGGLLSLFIATVNLGLMGWLRKNRNDCQYLVHTILGLVLTFVSITIPIQMEGNYITLLWASEMVLLAWLYVKTKIRVYEYAALVLVCLTFASFGMDVVYTLVHDNASGTIFLNGSFATSLFMGLATGLFALLMQRYRTFFSITQILCYTPWNAILLLASTIILYGAFMLEFSLFFSGDTESGAKLLFTAVAVFGVCFAFRNRFPMKQYTAYYILGMSFNALIYLFAIWLGCVSDLALCPTVLRWVSVVFVIATLCYVARQYYASWGIRPRFMIYLNVLATLLWLTMVRSFLWQIGVEEFSAGFSLSLGIAGLVQMMLGMRQHLKVLRLIGLSAFGIVLVKLTLVDLWALPTIGKIVVFILLGLMLLVLSFLYQKLKNVLFKGDEENRE